MKIRPVRNKEDILLERQRLRDHREVLGNAIVKDLKQLQHAASPVTLLSSLLRLWIRK